MIPNVVKGRGFHGVLSYVLTKPGAQFLGGNMDGREVRDLVREFRMISDLNPKVKSPVMHLSLSLTAGERRSDEQWVAIAEDVLKPMGFDRSQFVVVRHTDTDLDHVHIVANRVRFDGICVSSSHDFRRSQKAAEAAERKHGLVLCNHQRGAESLRENPTLDAPTPEVVKAISKDLAQHPRLKPNQVHKVLEEEIVRALEGRPSLHEFVDRLCYSGIEAVVTTNKLNGRIQGLSFRLGDQSAPLIPASQVRKDRSLSLPRLVEAGLLDLDLTLPLAPPADPHPRLAAPAKDPAPSKKGRAPLLPLTQRAFDDLVAGLRMPLLPRLRAAIEAQAKQMLEAFRARYQAPKTTKNRGASHPRVPVNLLPTMPGPRHPSGLQGGQGAVQAAALGITLQRDREALLAELERRRVAPHPNSEPEDLRRHHDPTVRFLPQPSVPEPDRGPEGPSRGR